MNINYLLTCSHVDYKNCGYRVNVHVFPDKNDAINKILEIHNEFCIPFDDQYSYSDGWNKYTCLNNPTYIDCVECKFINDQIHDIDPDNTISGGPNTAADYGLYVDEVYERILCNECAKNEALILENCHCGYYVNIRTHAYKRKMCENCVKCCVCNKCKLDIWVLVNCIMTAKPGTSARDSWNP